MPTLAFFTGRSGSTLLPRSCRAASVTCKCLRYAPAITGRHGCSPEVSADFDAAVFDKVLAFAFFGEAVIDFGEVYVSGRESGHLVRQFERLLAAESRQTGSIHQAKMWMMLAIPRIATGRLGKSRARSALVTRTAPPPSDSSAQSNNRYDGELRTRLLPAHGLVSDGQEGYQREYDILGPTRISSSSSVLNSGRASRSDYPVDR
jgi:hypothetical protein